MSRRAGLRRRVARPDSVAGSQPRRRRGGRGGADRVPARHTGIGGRRAVGPDRRGGGRRRQRFGGSFYNHFDSKEELFQAAVNEVLNELGAILDKLIRK